MQKSVWKKTESNAKSVATSNDISNHAQLYQGGAEDQSFRTPPFPFLSFLSHMSESTAQSKLFF